MTANPASVLTDALVALIDERIQLALQPSPGEGGSLRSMLDRFDEHLDGLGLNTDNAVHGDDDSDKTSDSGALLQESPVSLDADEASHLTQAEVELPQRSIEPASQSVHDAPSRRGDQRVSTAQPGSAS